MCIIYDAVFVIWKTLKLKKKIWTNLPGSATRILIVALIFLMGGSVDGVGADIEEEQAVIVPVLAVSPVYWIQDAYATDSYVPVSSAVRGMVDVLISELTGEATPREGWKKLVKPGDRVGLKVDASGGPGGSTRLAVIEAVLRGLESAGISRTSVVIWDRERAALNAAGITSQRFGCKVYASEEAYSRELPFSSPVLGQLVYGDLDFKSESSVLDVMGSPDALSSISYFPEFLKPLTKIINLPVLKNNRYYGLHGALANVTIPNVDNWRRFVREPRHGASEIPEIYADPILYGKCVLHLMDALIVQYAGGPDFAPNYSFAHNSLYASRDPVSLDAVALEQLEIWRNQAELPSIEKMSAHVKASEAFGLGNAAKKNIKIIRVKR